MTRVSLFSVLALREMDRTGQWTSKRLRAGWSHHPQLAPDGPAFGFSDTWQLFINTGTTIVTFLMVFLIQNTQNRDSAAVQLKLDEIIRAVEGAHIALLDLEELPERDLIDFRNQYEKLARAAREDVSHGIEDTGTPDVER